jgi:hypothetical protein
VWIYVHYYTEENGLTQWVGTWVEHDWKFLTKKFGKKVSRYTLCMDKKVKMFCIPCEFTKGQVQQRQKTDTSQPLSSATPQSWTKWWWWKRWSLYIGLSSWTSHLRRLTLLQPPINVTFSRSRSQSWVLGFPSFLGVIYQLHGRRLITLDSNDHGGFFLLKVSLTLDIDSSSLHAILLPKLASAYLHNDLFTIMFMQHYSDERTYFIPKEMWHCAILMRFTGLRILPTILKYLFW